MERSTLAAHRSRILALAADHGVTDVRLFGSTVRGQSTPKSDVDLLVALEEGRSLVDLVAFKLELEELLGCSVDVVSERALSPYLEERVLREALPL